MHREQLAENLLTFLPAMHKKLFKGLTFCDITKQQLEFLVFLDIESGKSMSYYGSKMMISKSNLTVLADKLIEDEYIVREQLPGDRRVIILKLTKKGEEYLKIQRDKVKSQLIKRLEVFDVNDIERLSNLIKESSRIMNKLNEVE